MATKLLDAPITGNLSHAIETDAELRYAAAQIRAQARGAA